MTVTDWLLPQTMSQVAYGSQYWRNPDYAKSCNGGTYYAYAPLSAWTYILIGTNYGFSIPTSATIDGVNAYFRVCENIGGSGVHDVFVMLYNGFWLGNNKALGNLWGATYPTYTTLFVGGGADLWGATLTPTIVNDSAFGFGMAAGGDAYTALCDCIGMRIYYTDILPSISKINGISKSSISKINGISKSSISKINGIT